MYRLTELIEKMWSDEIDRWILSSPHSGEIPYRKIIGRRLEEQYQLEQQTETQVFHRWLQREDVPAF